MNRVNRHLTNSRGFTLVELLIVSGLVGIVMAAVLGLVVTTQRHTYTSEEVVDVQQNLRVALDFMSRDLRLAGFGVADDAVILEAPQGLCQNDDEDCLDMNEFGFLRFQTLTATGEMARIGPDGGVTTTTDEQNIVLADAKSAQLLLSRAESGPVYVRIFRPSSRTQPLDRVFKVSSPEPSEPPEPPEVVTVTGFTESTVLRPGDLLARVDYPGPGDSNTDPPQHPNQVDYRLVKADSDDEGQFVLVRVPTGADPDDEETFQRIAGKITNVEFRYLLDDGSEADWVTGSDLERIRAIRITLVGATDGTRTGIDDYIKGQGDNVKTRALSTVVELRNR